MISRVSLPLVAVLTVSLAAEVRDLRRFFQERCAVCHGPDGTARGPAGARLGGRNLADAHWLAKQEEGGLATTILRGRGAMPGFRRQLSESEARQLLSTVIRPFSGKKSRPDPLPPEPGGP